MEEQIETPNRLAVFASQLYLARARMPLECTGTLGGGLPPHPHHLGTCPEPGTSAGGNAGIGCGWFGQWGSSADACRSKPHYTAGCGGRSPGKQKLLYPTLAEFEVVLGTSNSCALVSGISTSIKFPEPPLYNCDGPCGHIPTSRLGPPLPSCS